MKKIFMMLFMVTLCLVLVACNSQDTTGQIASSLQNDTQKLLTTINELDTLNSQDILIQEISPIASMNSYNNDTTSLTKNYSLIDNSYSNNNGNGLYNNGTITARRANTQNGNMQDINNNNSSTIYNTNRINRFNNN